MLDVSSVAFLPTTTPIGQSHFLPPDRSGPVSTLATVNGDCRFVWAQRRFVFMSHKDDEPRDRDLYKTPRKCHPGVHVTVCIERTVFLKINFRDRPYLSNHG